MCMCKPVLAWSLIPVVTLIQKSLFVRSKLYGFARPSERPTEAPPCLVSRQWLAVFDICPRLQLLLWSLLSDQYR